MSVFWSWWVLAWLQNDAVNALIHFDLYLDTVYSRHSYIETLWQFLLSQSSDCVQKVAEHKILKCSKHSFGAEATGDWYVLCVAGVCCGSQRYTAPLWSGSENSSSCEEQPGFKSVHTGGRRSVMNGRLWRAALIVLFIKAAILTYKTVIGQYLYTVQI